MNLVILKAKDRNDSILMQFFSLPPRCHKATFCVFFSVLLQAFCYFAINFEVPCVTCSVLFVLVSIWHSIVHLLRSLRSFWRSFSRSVLCSALRFSLEFPLVFSQCSVQILLPYRCLVCQFPFLLRIFNV